MSIVESLCQTSFGKFRIKVDNNIIVGGKIFCVNIVLYENETSLYLLKTDKGGSELNEKEIIGDNTVKMADLAFSLLRKYYPLANPVILLDDSGFSWKDGYGKKYKINFLKSYLLLHRKTWYEDKFNAVMCDANIYKIYRTKADNNFDDPSKKPEVFDFMNSNVKEILDPLYKSSKTWTEFIDKLVIREDKYNLIYHWYRQAIYVIFDGIEINQDWKIDILQRPYIEYDSTQGGGKRVRVRTSKNRRVTFSKYNRLEPFSWSLE